MMFADTLLDECTIVSFRSRLRTLIPGLAGFRGVAFRPQRGDAANACRRNTFAEVVPGSQIVLRRAGGQLLPENNTFSELWFTSAAGGRRLTSYC